MIGRVSWQAKAAEYLEWSQNHNVAEIVIYAEGSRFIIGRRRSIPLLTVGSDGFMLRCHGANDSSIIHLSHKEVDSIFVYGDRKTDGRRSIFIFADVEESR